MAWLFGKGKKKQKKQEAPTIEENSEKLSKTIEDLKKKNEYDQARANELLRQAVAYKKQGNDKKAKDCLKKKKLIEMNMAKIEQMQTNLEAQQMQIQNAETTSKVFEAYKQNNEVMKNQFKGYDIDQIQDTLDEIQDNQESFNEITDAIAGSNFGPQLDDDELEDELANLDIDQDVEATTGVADSPAAYAAPAATANANDEQDIGNLMAGFN